jgi:hypothetical protein
VKYEYYIFPKDVILAWSNYIKRFNELGEDGWELCCMLKNEAFFKRRL